MLAVLVAAASGALLSLALPPTGVWPLFLALAPLFALVARAPSARRAFWLGAAFALPFFGIYILWLPRSFSQPSMLGPFFWGVFPLLLAALCLIWGAVTFAARWVGGRGRGTLWLLPGFWVLTEWLRTQGYLAFPWGTLGYLWLGTPAAQIASAVGVYGLSLLAAGAAALVAVPFVPPAGRPKIVPPTPAGRAGLAAPLLAVALVGAAMAWGATDLARPLPTPDRTAVLVQGNIDPFGRAISPAGDLGVHTGLTRQAVARLGRTPTFVIWPEGAVLGYSVEGPQGEATRAAIQASAPGAAFIVGGRAFDGGKDYNSAYSVADGRVIDRYDKAYLVPFGERWPLLETAKPLYRAIFGLLHLPMLVNTAAGPGPIPLRTPHGPVATYICYESVFPQVQRVMVRDGARVLVNITNDAWFSEGNGAEQHFAMGNMRAIETGRYLLRAGNDGITAAVDPHGRVLERLPRHVAGALTVHFAFRDTRTPFVRFGRWYIPALAVLTALATLVVLVRRRS
ncbi:MAG: apolipoprotein N-acyltransferase [Deinococcales bacterium]